jgi:hypothetical protein
MIQQFEIHISNTSLLPTVLLCNQWVLCSALTQTTQKFAETNLFSGEDLELY